MKTTIGFLLCIVAFCFITIMQSSAQDKPFMPSNFPKRVFTPSLPAQPLSDRAVLYRIAGKRASQYTAEDWGTLIDSTWGPGQTAAEQLNVFDTFWNLVDKHWAGFPNLNLNWDSMRTVYRPQIGSGLSRGRFCALMSRMWLALLEHHTTISDGKVDSIFIPGGKWQYKRGVPLLVPGTGGWDLIGAPITPMPDSSGLVYRVAPGNPLGLEPGDLVLGYEGIQWKRLYAQLLDYGVPVSSGWSSGGTTPQSNTHEVLSSVGWHWGLFDTIDVVKYSTGDTLHLPTAPLATLTQSVWATDQVPIAGVPMPQEDINGTGAVSWGVVQGTNIGYVYAWDWGTASTPQLFHDAIYDLRNNKKVEGLVIDFRTNWGGNPSYANEGLQQLFNFDPTSNMSFATRNDSSNHLGFSFSNSNAQFLPTANLFDRPIAVLIGPLCLSAGDWNAFRMRFHPMVRFFGKPTNGAFVGGSYASGTIPDAWSYQIPTNIIYSNVPGEGYMIHKGVQPDEEVWLTRDGVAKGKDDVVERALAWITTLTYAHDVAINRSYTGSHLDSVSVTAWLTDSLEHSAALSAIVTDTLGVVRDSLHLYNDGMHRDGQAGDSVWGCRIPAPSDGGLFKITIRTDDSTQGSYRKLPNIVGFATGGLLTLDSVGFSKSTAYYKAKPYVHNGLSFTVHGAMMTIRCNDPWVIKFSPSSGVVSLPDLPPGTTWSPSSMILVYYNAAAHPTYFNLKFDFSVGGVTYWTDSTKLTVTGVEEKKMLPITYELRQNFPNPFNPTTVISYQLPVSSYVTLKIFDLLGREVSVLVNEKKDAGVHEVTFNGSKFASGVYFYRLQAGEFVQTRKLMILK